MATGVMLFTPGSERMASASGMAAGMETGSLSAEGKGAMQISPVMAATPSRMA